MAMGTGIVVQNCFIVDDIDAAINRWVKDIGAGPFFVRRHMTDLAFKYRGEPSSGDFSLALGQAGPVQIELMQIHSDRPNIYTDLFPKPVRNGFHHVAMFALDFDGALKAYRDKGVEIAMEGAFGATRFAFADVSRDFGFMIELYQDTADMRGLYKMIADAAIGWDGTDPVRPL
jgi:hypothetical protein